MAGQATSQNKLGILIPKLLERTQRGEISWQETADESRFLFSSAEYSIAVAHDSGSSYTYETFELSVINERGITIDSLSIRANLEESIELAELYASAKRRALGADEILDKVLKDFG